MRFYRLYKGDAISPEYAPGRDARSARKVELGFGRTLKLEQIIYVLRFSGAWKWPISQK